MPDKNAHVPEFLRMFDGACLEAKNGNIQTWLSRAAGIEHAAHSDESYNLAHSVTAEFNVITDEWRLTKITMHTAKLCQKLGIEMEETTNLRVYLK